MDYIDYTDRDMLKTKCLICGKVFDYLGTHVVQKHKPLTARDYKDAFGIDHKLRLISDEIADKKSVATKANGTIKNLFSPKSIQNRFGAGARDFKYKRSPMTLERLETMGKQKMEYVLNHPNTKRYIKTKKRTEYIPLSKRNKVQ